MTYTHLLTSIVLAAALTVGTTVSASAACYADYKAKQDDPLRLHYGVVQISDAACSDKGRARAEVAARIARGGWELLNLLSVFGDDGLDSHRASAGEYFLRY